MTVTFNFRLISDDALTLNDRIVYSFLCQFEYSNRRRVKEGRRPLAITIRRLRRATGYRHATVAASLDTLVSRLYVTPDLQVLNNPNCPKGRYVKLDLHKYTDAGRKVARYPWGIDRQVFMMMKAGPYENRRPNWWRKALGISRRTYFRWNQWLHEDDEGAGMDAEHATLECAGYRAYW